MYVINDNMIFLTENSSMKVQAVVPLSNLNLSN